MQRRTRRVAFVVAPLLIFMFGVGTVTLTSLPAGATSPAASGVSWLKTQQQSDGGFEVAHFPGFETPDAVFAIASAAQTTSSWSTSEARAAVLGTQTSSHLTPLHNLDDYADSGIGAGQAAKLIVLVTNPLGLDPNTFDPDCDGGSGMDLQALLGSPGVNGKYGQPTEALNNILYAARATKALGGTVDAVTLQLIRDQQLGSGAYAFDGLAASFGPDVDTTANAIQAMLAAGLNPASDTTLVAALNWLEGQQLTTPSGAAGAWPAFGSADTNSTGVALAALAAAGRTTHLAAGDTWLLSQQQGNGRFASQNDAFPPINTSATAQAIEGLVRMTVPANGTGGAASCTDGNRDGIDDSGQTTVKTVPAISGTGMVTVATSAGTLSAASSIDPTTQPSPPSGVTFPNGLVGFTVTGLTNGATVTAQVYLHAASTATSYYKLRNGVWTDFTSHASFADAPGGGRVVTLTLTDGGAGDADGIANGTIVDPGAPAVVAAQTDPGLVARFTG